MSRARLFRSASFRLAALYLALFMASALALGAFIYASVRREIRADFDDRIIEETDALMGLFSTQGLEGLTKALEARRLGGGFAYGLEAPDGTTIVGALRAAPSPTGWIETHESDDNEQPEAHSEVVRALVTRMPDGSTLVVGDEQRRLDDLMGGLLSDFGWAVAATTALGIIGGLWLSAQYLRRIDSMRRTAHGLMAGDWSRRIPVLSLDDDVSALARTFNRLFDRIEKLLQANRRVSADLAHDLRKPLARVLRRLEAAKDADRGSASADAIAATIADIEGVLETFDALLRISEIEAGARRAAFQPVDLGEIARNVADAFEPPAEEEGKALVVRLRGALPMSGDKDLLAQLIANLLDNALRHTPKGARIEVTGEATQHGVRLSVADDGPGVPPEDLAAIFRQFHRAGKARASPGTGLGLSLVAAIAELHDLAYEAVDNCPGLRVTLRSSGED